MIALSTISYFESETNMDIVLLIARILFAGMFAMSGINHITKADAMTGYAQFKKVPAPKLSVQLSGLLLALGGLSIILGVYADLGAIVIAALLIAMAVKMHDFWAADAASKPTEMISFLKNISMAGGALFIFAIAATTVDGTAINIGWTLTDSLFSFAN
jgi:uncharacterized membrane protein YphA (DoxX/SURF4 family)